MVALIAFVRRHKGVRVRLQGGFEIQQDGATGIVYTKFDIDGGVEISERTFGDQRFVLAGGPFGAGLMSSGSGVRCA